MQLSDAVEIKEVFGVDAVNLALKDGWKLLAATSAHNTSQELDVCYTLGKPRAQHLTTPTEARFNNQQKR